MKHLPESALISRMTHWSYNRLALDVICWFVALLALAALMAALGVFSAGWVGNDESPHFINSYLIWVYLNEGLGQNPLSFAQDFYIHYPKVTIGHWPPLYYFLIAPLFSILPPSHLNFIIVNTIVAALPALIVIHLVRRAIGPLWALVAGVTYVLLPQIISNSMYFMLDQATTALILIAAVFWSEFSQKPSWRLGVGWALATAAAILVKGNAWLLGLYPLLHMMLTARWRIMLDYRFYVLGLAILAITAPWYILTSNIPAASFKYSWGVDFFVEAMPQFVEFLIGSVGIPVAIAALLSGVFSLLFQRQPNIRELAKVCIALIAATLLFHSIVPMSIISRYTVFAAPAMVILAVMGAGSAITHFAQRRVPSWAAAFLTLALLAIPGVMHAQDRSAKFDMHMARVAEQLLRDSGSKVVVVDGYPGAEGSLIVELAVRDLDRAIYVVRTSKLLVDADWSMIHYKMKVKSREEVLHSLRDIGASVIVVARNNARTKTIRDHNQLFVEAVESPGSPFRLVATFEHNNGKGETRIYQLPESQPPSLEAVKEVNWPKKSL